MWKGFEKSINRSDVQENVDDLFYVTDLIFVMGSHSPGSLWIRKNGFDSECNKSCFFPV